jgi:hypothetical protein
LAATVIFPLAATAGGGVRDKKADISGFYL